MSTTKLIIPTVEKSIGFQAVKIFIAEQTHLIDVQACARAAYEKYVVRMDREPAPMNADFEYQISCGQVYVALIDDLFAGYVVFYPEGDCIHLENIAVLPRFAGTGIGRQLMEYVENAARQQDLTSVELYTNEAMVENLQMYPRLGYVETKRMQQDGFKRVFFKKDI